MTTAICNSTPERVDSSERDLLIALATYNEIDNLPELVERLLETAPDADVLVVDDDSPDGTGRWAEERAAVDPRVEAIVRKNERGLGSAVVAALRFAVERNYRRVVNLDADFSHPVEALPRLLARLDGGTPGPDGAPLPPVDVVIGSRYVPGGATPDWPLRRRLTSRCVNAFARATLGLKTNDNSGAYRCYRVETLRKLDFGNIVSRGYSFFEELLFRLRRVGATFAEIPIIFVDRTRGVSKINRKEAVKAIAIMTRLGLSRLSGRQTD